VASGTTAMPWSAVGFVTFSDGRDDKICSGSMVSATHVLTAAVGPRRAHRLPLVQRVRCCCLLFAVCAACCGVACTRAPS
jgi:hypothetical protein